MTKESYLKIQTELLKCAGGYVETEDALRKWFLKYVHEFGAADFIPRAHSDAAIDETKFVREQLHRRIGEEICRAEAAVESLEPYLDGHERKARLFVVCDPSSVKSIPENKKPNF